MSQLVLSTDFPDLQFAGRGKVRDIYDLGKTLLIVTTDRVSAFDVIMNEAIPDKGFCAHADFRFLVSPDGGHRSESHHLD